MLGITVEGSSGSVATPATASRSKVGLKHHWFTPQVPGSAPSYPRDVTGDGQADVVAIEASGGALRVYPTNGRGRVEGRRSVRERAGRATPRCSPPERGTTTRSPTSSSRTRAGSSTCAAAPVVGTFGAASAIGAGLDGARPRAARRRLRRGRPHRPHRPPGRRRRSSCTPGTGVGGFASARAGRSAVAGTSSPPCSAPATSTATPSPTSSARTSDGTVYLYRGNGVGWLDPAAHRPWHRVAAVHRADRQVTSPVTGRPTCWRARPTAFSGCIPGDGLGAVGPARPVGDGWNIFSSICSDGEVDSAA